MSHANPNATQLAQPTSGLPEHTCPRTVTSAELLAGQRELLIQHGAEQYRLRLTAQGKLILTK